MNISFPDGSIFFLNRRTMLQLEADYENWLEILMETNQFFSPVILQNNINWNLTTWVTGENKQFITSNIRIHLRLWFIFARLTTY